MREIHMNSCLDIIIRYISISHFNVSSLTNQFCGCVYTHFINVLLPHTLHRDLRLPLEGFLFDIDTLSRPTYQIHWPVILR